MKFLLFFFAALLLVFGCENPKPEVVIDNTPVAVTPKVIPFPFDLSDVELISKDTMESYWAKLTSVDLFPKSLDYNISFADTNSVRSFLKMIAPEAPVYHSDCQSAGRIILNSGKTTAAHVEIFLDVENKCNTLVFLKDEKPVFSNRLNDTGISHFTKIFNKRIEVEE